MRRVISIVLLFSPAVCWGQETPPESMAPVWRAGANENTVFQVSHDVKVEGKALPAGTYGLHMIPGPKKFTIILKTFTV